MFNQSGSRRWTHFHSALQLAISRSARKWTFDDFAECFPGFVEEDKNGALATFNSISDYIEAQNFRDLDKLFKEYGVQENIDILHKVVNEAKDRKSRGDAGEDVWKEDLDPRHAVTARTVPVFEAEVQRLRETLAAAEQENKVLLGRLEENTKATNAANGRVQEILSNVDRAYEEWQNLPMDDLEAWTVQTTETLKPTLPS